MRFLNFLYLAASNHMVRCKSALFFDTKSIRINQSANKFNRSYGFIRISAPMHYKDGTQRELYVKNLNLCI